MGGFKEYGRYDALGLAELVKKDDITASELCEEAIKRIEQVNPKLNAVVAKMYDIGRSAAARTAGGNGKALSRNTSSPDP